jgi:hypothetical protein
MPDTNRSHNDFIPLDEMEERELRRGLIMKSREGDADAQAKLFALYGVKISSSPEVK